MSWQAAAMGLLALALLGGVVAYERSRPPAQVVALVAVLAALAAAGRVALSPVPNVVPTTDIALLSGYSLGGPAGFAVGSLAGLVSNFWLGQGPWTPWQMAGWGLAGLLGAWLALVGGRRLGRFGLAAACGLAGLLFGALMDLSLMVTYGGEQTLERYLAISARSLPFNAAHVAGNVAFALVAGPALARMLGRYRARFEFAWSGRRGGRSGPAGPGAATAALALAALLLAAAVLPDGTAAAARSGTVAEPGAATAARKGAGAAAAWLAARQNADGGFAATPGGDSSAAITGWAVLALEARGRHPASVRRAGHSALDYLRSTAGEISSTGDIERTILVLASAGLDPRDFAGRDLVARLLARRGRDGSWGRQVNPTAFGVLALEAVGRGGSGGSVAWLRRAANADGGWGFARGAASDADSTGAVLQALAAAGGSEAEVRAGVRFLRDDQRAGGGFALLGGPPNAQSTAWAVQGLLAAGVSPASVLRGERSGLDYLSSLQAGDGHYRYSRSSDQTPVWVTSQALLAAGSGVFPLDRVSAGASASGSGASGSGGGSGAAAAAATATGSPTATGAGAAAAPGSDGAAAGGAAGAAPTAAAGAATAAPAALAAEPASSRFESGGDEGSSTPLLAGALAAFAVALGGAWALGRRRPGPEDTSG